MCVYANRVNLLVAREYSLLVSHGNVTRLSVAPEIDPDLINRSSALLCTYGDEDMPSLCVLPVLFDQSYLCRKILRQKLTQTGSIACQILQTALNLCIKVMSVMCYHSVISQCCLSALDYMCNGGGELDNKHHLRFIALY